MSEDYKYFVHYLSVSLGGGGEHILEGFATKEEARAFADSKDYNKRKDGVPCFTHLIGVYKKGTYNIDEHEDCVEAASKKLSVSSFQNAYESQKQYEEAGL